MLPSRSVPGVQDAINKDRKSRMDARPSMLPKPRRPYSTERKSTEARSSGIGQRSSSAEPPRHTVGGARLSREASATKLAGSGRPRSQQVERFTTPLRSSHYMGSKTTPRTPSDDRGSRKWQSCLERALCFVTIRDERPLSNAAWQRAEYARVAEGLGARGGGMVLVRPLTIARFVDITGALLAVLCKDSKLTTDNYVTKLPHLLKRLLYPGTVSKSWLKTVNTLHAFPHALALISYLLDLVNHVELPVSDDLLYKDKDEISLLRRDYLNKCWLRFQGPVHDYTDIDEEYLQSLKTLLGCEDEKFEELNNTIKKYTECLQDEEEAAARDEEARLVAYNAALAAELKDVRADRSRTRAQLDALRTRRRDLADMLLALDADIERARSEKERVAGEVERQALSVSERARLLDQIDYAARVRSSKEALAQEVAKMVQSKDNELALWQRNTLDSCMEYKQCLIRLTPQFPELASLNIDEKELMEAECATRMSNAVEVLRELSARLAERRAEHARNKAKLARQRTALVEEVRVKVAEVKSAMEREQQALELEVSKEKADTAAWNAELQDINTRLEELRSKQEEYLKIDQDLEYWKEQENSMRVKLSELQQYVEEQRVASARLLRDARDKRLQLLLHTVHNWNHTISQPTNRPTDQPTTSRHNNQPTSHPIDQPTTSRPNNRPTSYLTDQPTTT